MPGVMDYLTKETAGGAALEVIRNREKARKGARRGLLTTGGGFGLQIVAQLVVLYA